MDGILGTIAVLLLFSMLLPVNAFPVLYAFSPWYGSAVGRALMTLAVGLMLLVDFAVFYRFVPGPTPDWLRVIVYGIITAGLYYQFAVLVRYQFRRRRDSDRSRVDAR